MAMDLANATFRGYRRENGRVGVRNHVIVLPVDDLSNAACEAVANNIKGAMAIPHPYGRLQFGADLELHFRTLIGAGANPNVAAVVVIGIEEGWTQRVVNGIAATGKPVTGYGIELHGDHETIMRASKTAREYVQWASEAVREDAPLADLWVSTKCGESDTTSGCGSNPTVGNAFDKLYPLGATMVFGETTEITGGEHLVAERCRTPEIRERFMYMFNRYQEIVERHKTSDLSESQPTKGNIAGGLTTIEEKALGNIQKIGREVRDRRCARQSGNAGRPRVVVHGLLFGRRRDGDAVRRGRVRGAFLPHRPGQHHRQPDPAEHQDLREPAHRAHHGRACRCRRLGLATPGNDTGRGGRRAARHDDPHRQRKADGGGGPRPSRVRAHKAVRERLSRPVPVSIPVSVPAARAAPLTGGASAGPARPPPGFQVRPIFGSSPRSRRRMLAAWRIQIMTASRPATSANWW